MGFQAVRNGPGGPFLTGDHSAWNTGMIVQAGSDWSIVIISNLPPSLT